MHTLTVRDIVNGDVATNVKTVTQAISIRVRWSLSDPYTPGQYAVWSDTDPYTPGKPVYFAGE